MNEAQRRQFYELMLLDTERLLHTVEQVLKAGEAAQKKKPAQRLPVEFNALVRECMELARTRHHLQPEDLEYRESLSLRSCADDTSRRRGACVLGDPEELRTAVSNLLDNAVKYSPDGVHISVELDAPDEERVGAAGARSRRGNSRGRVEADFQAVLPGDAALAARK